MAFSPLHAAKPHVDPRGVSLYAGSSFPLPAWSAGRVPFTLLPVSTHSDVLIFIVL